MFGCLKMMKSLQRGFSTGFSRVFAMPLIRKPFADNMSKAEKRLRAREDSMKSIYQRKLESRLTQKSGNTFMGWNIDEWIEEQILSCKVHAYGVKSGLLFTKPDDKMVQMIDKMVNMVKCPMLPMGDLPFVDIIRVSLELQNLCREQWLAFMIKTRLVHLSKEDWEKVQYIMIKSKSSIPAVVQIRDLLEPPEIVEHRLMEMQMLCDNQFLAFHIKSNLDPSFLTSQDKQTLIKLMATASLDIPILETIRNYLEAEEILELQIYACILKSGYINYFACSEFHQLTEVRLKFKSNIAHLHLVNYIEMVHYSLQLDEVSQELHKFWWPKVFNGSLVPIKKQKKFNGSLVENSEELKKYKVHELLQKGQSWMSMDTNEEERGSLVENSEELKKYKVHELLQKGLSWMSMDTNEEEREDDGLPSLHKDDDKQDLPEPEEPDTNKFLTPDELERGKLPPEEILSHPMFKNYTPGNPGPVLHIKNLSRFVIADDFYFIFGSLFGNIEDAKSGLQVTLVQEGMLFRARARVQAFLTFPSTKLAHHALNLVNGYVFKGNPMIIRFVRKPAAAK